MKFLKDGLSLDEFKASALVLVFVIFSIIGSYAYIATGDITTNWLELLLTFVYVIGGVNMVKSVSDVIDRKKSKKDNNDTEAKG